MTGQAENSTGRVKNSWKVKSPSKSQLDLTKAWLDKSKRNWTSRKFNYIKNGRVVPPPLSTSIECRLGPAPLSLHLNVEWDYSWNGRVGPLSTSIECRMGPAPLLLHLNAEWDYSWNLGWYFTYIKNGRGGPSLHLSLHLLNVDWDQPPFFFTWM